MLDLERVKLTPRDPGRFLNLLVQGWRNNRDCGVS